MPAKDHVSADWTNESVIARLRRDARDGKRTSVQVFLRPELKDEDAGTAYDNVRIETEAASPAAATRPVFGKFRKLSRSFSVEAEPEAIEKICARPDVSAILPNEVEDILPKPKNVRHSA
jgi:hypothetical protein